MLLFLVQYSKTYDTIIKTSMDGGDTLNFKITSLPFPSLRLSPFPVSHSRSTSTTLTFSFTYSFSFPNYFSIASFLLNINKLQLLGCCGIEMTVGETRI